MRNWINNAFNTTALQEKRYSWIDYLRGIAIILVVYHHVRIGIERIQIKVPEVIVEANMIFYSFRMPLFFLLSGIFINLAFAKKSFKELVSSKFEKLLYPYFIWVFIQVTLQIVLSEFTNSQRGFEDYTYIFYHPRYLDQFWYLPALFNVSMFFLLIRRRFDPPAWVHLVVGLVLYFSSPFILKISMLSDWMEFYIFFAIGNVITPFFFKPSTQKFLSDYFSFFIFLPLFISLQLYYLKNDIAEKTLDPNLGITMYDYLYRMYNQLQFLVIALVGCLMMLIVAFRLQRMNILSFLRVLGYHSLYVYVLHVMIIAFVRVVMVNVFNITEPVTILIVSIFFGVTVPVVFYNLLVKDGPLWFLFFFKKRKKNEATIASGIPELNSKAGMVASHAS